MIARIYDYFGVIGVASIAAWLLALAALVVYAVKVRKPRVIHAALLIGVVAIVLAEINSSNIDTIQVLPEAPPAADADKVNERTLKTIQTRASEIRFAEDDKATGTAAKKPGDADLSYDYRKSGKQTRESGRSLGHGVNVPTTTPAASQPAEADVTPSASESIASNVRRMSSIDVTLANRYDGMNLRIARFTLFAAVVLLLIDYLRRFNLITERLTPLPVPPLIANFVSQVFSPARRVLIARQGDGDALPRVVAESAVRKGEAFVYFGSKDPWAEPSLTKLPVARHSCRMDKLAIDDSPNAYRPVFVADAVWYGRASAVVIGEKPTASVLGALLERAGRRETIEPAARRRINVIWDHATPPPATAFADLSIEAARQNLRVLVIADTSTADRTKFDTVITSRPEILGRPPLCERLLAAADRWCAHTGIHIARPIVGVARSLLKRIDRSLSGPDRDEPIVSSDPSTT